MDRQTAVAAEISRPALTPRQRANLELLLLEIKIKVELKKQGEGEQAAGELRCLCQV